MATDKIPHQFYSEEFIMALAGLLGQAAAVSMVLGRADSESGTPFYDDGDEVLLMKNNLPHRIILSETTGSFCEWKTGDLREKVPCFAGRFSGHMEIAKARGVGPGPLDRAVRFFAHGLRSEITRLQYVVRTRRVRFYSLFKTGADEHEGIHARWTAILGRIERTDTEQVFDVALSTLCSGVRE